MRLTRLAVVVSTMIIALWTAPAHSQGGAPQITISPDRVRAGAMAGLEWLFATSGQRYVGTAPVEEAELVVTNVSDTAARVEVSSFEGRPGYSGGSRGYAFEIDIPAQRMLRIPIVPEPIAGDRDIGADYVVVKGVGSTSPAALVVERTHRWSVGGVARAGASSIIGNLVR